MQTTVTGGALRLPFRFSSAKPRPQNHLAFLERRFTPRTVFMEIGAASCDFAVHAAGYVERVYAIDVSGHFLPNVPAPCNLRLVLCDGVRIPLSEGSVDVAWSGRFLDQLHPDERLEHLRSVRRCLAPGGVYFCNPAGTPATVLRSFVEAGFSVVRFYFGGLRIPPMLARFVPPETVRYAAL